MMRSTQELTDALQEPYVRLAPHGIQLIFPERVICLESILTRQINGMRFVSETMATTGCD